MAISTVSGSVPASSSALAANASSQAAANATADPAMLNQSDFLQLLTAQLKNQDPTNPVDDTNFTAQLAQFSTLSGVQQLNTTIQQMLQLQQLTQGADLVGKVVSYGPSSANPSQGTVNSISVQNGQLMVQIGGQSVSSDQVYGIQSSSGS